MSDYYLPYIEFGKLSEAINTGDLALFELLVQPLHEELYRRKDFIFMDSLTEAQQLLLAYDYLQQQVAQGGFIQFLANGYIGLLPDMPRWLENVGSYNMAKVIDDVLKVYVLNVALFREEITTQEFAQLYDKVKEFEIIENRFHKYNKETISHMMRFAKNNLEQYVKTDT